jgi:type IV pilus assembly protein PilF
MIRHLETCANRASKARALALRGSLTLAALAACVGGALTVGSAAIGCSPKGTGGMTAQSPERQSEAEYDVARDLFGRGEVRRALDHALKACELNDENPKALYFTAAIYLSFCAGDRGLEDPDCKIDKAEKYAKAAVKADDTFRDAKNLLGQVYILEKKYREAEQILEPLTRDPAYTEGFLAWGNLGWAQVLDGAVDAGIVSLKNAVALQPKFCVGFYRLGVAYEKKNDLPSAEKAQSGALAIEGPECQTLQVAWEARGHVRAKLSRPDDAKKDFTECVKLSATTGDGKKCVAQLASLGGAPVLTADGGKP